MPAARAAARAAAAARPRSRRRRRLRAGRPVRRHSLASSRPSTEANSRLVCPCQNPTHRREDRPLDAVPPVALVTPAESPTLSTSVRWGRKRHAYRSSRRRATADTEGCSTGCRHETCSHLVNARVLRLDLRLLPLPIWPAGASRARHVDAVLPPVRRGCRGDPSHRAAPGSGDPVRGAGNRRIAHRGRHHVLDRASRGRARTRTLRLDAPARPHQAARSRQRGHRARHSRR